MSFFSAISISDGSVFFYILGRKCLWDGSHLNKMLLCVCILQLNWISPIFGRENFLCQNIDDEIWRIFQTNVDITWWSFESYFINNPCIGLERPISCSQYTRAINPAAFLEGFRRNPSCTGISWVITAKYVMPLISGGRLQNLTSAITNKNG